MAEVRFTILSDRGDQRGSSYLPSTAWLAFLGAVQDLHITTILPGHVRANHYHAKRKEVLVVLAQDRWLLKWDNGPSTPPLQQSFDEPGAVIVEVDPLAGHAVSNTGQKPLWVLGICDGVWDPQAPDSFARQLIA